MEKRIRRRIAHGQRKRKQKTEKVGRNRTDEGMIYGKPLPKSRAYRNADSVTGTCVIKGDVIAYESVTLKSGDKCIIKFDITDYTDSVTCKLFADVNDEPISKNL